MLLGPVPYGMCYVPRLNAISERGMVYVCLWSLLLQRVKMEMRCDRRFYVLSTKMTIVGVGVIMCAAINILRMLMRI